MPKLNRRSHRLRDFSLYILIAVAFAGLSILLGMHAAKTGQRPDIAFKWVGFALNTAFVFGSTLRVMRPFLRRPKLWAMMVGLLLLHGSLGAVVILRVERIPLIWYVPIDAAEIAVLIRLLLWTFAEDKPQKA
jgi:heme A synthase